LVLLSHTLKAAALFAPAKEKRVRRPHLEGTDAADDKRRDGRARLTPAGPLGGVLA